jgi:FkbM family methyltransferase
MPDVRTALRRSPRLFRFAQQAYVYGRYLRGRPHEADFAGFGELSGDGLFLDIGANSGTSAMSFRIYRPDNPILCIEPLALHARDLMRTSRLVKNMQCMYCAAGASPGVLTLHVPYFRGSPLSQYASLYIGHASPGNLNMRRLLGEQAYGPDFEIRTERTPVVRIDDLDVAPSFVKIDVQGAEQDVLDGMSATLAEHRPVLLIEISGDWEMVEHVRGLGYVPHVYDGRLRPFEGKMVSANMFFLPA